MTTNEKEKNNSYAVEMYGITKKYPGTLALYNVDYKLHKGLVNVLIGQNGAGKSTLMRLLAGIEKPTEGKIYKNGEEIELHGPTDAVEKGIAIIHQELNLFPHLTVTQNIFMGQENADYKGLYIRYKKKRKEATKILEKLEHYIDPDMHVNELRMGQQQIVEIAKTMVQENIEVLIMDEPTSSLSTAEVEILFKLIKELKQQGITIVYISHRMEEILRIGDYVTVLRDGEKVGEDWVKNIDLSWMVKSMVGQARNHVEVEKKERFLGEEVLRVKNLHLPSETGEDILNDISFELQQGEVLGIYGLLGSGRTEIFECLMGMRPEARSEIYIRGKKTKTERIGKQIKKGLFMVPEDRKDTGLIHSLSVGKNLTIASLSSYSKYGSLNTKTERDATDKIIDQLSIKVGDIDLPIYSLSGGNQQKVVIGKGLMTKPTIYLMDEPTRGIDVGAKEEVFKFIYDIASQGCGVIVVASELQEILRVSDRVIVLSGGKIASEFSSDEFDEEALVKASEKNLKIH